MLQKDPKNQGANRCFCKTFKINYGNIKEINWKQSEMHFKTLLSFKCQYPHETEHDIGTLWKVTKIAHNMIKTLFSMIKIYLTSLLHIKKYNKFHIKLHISRFSTVEETENGNVGKLNLIFYLFFCHPHLTEERL